MNSFRYEPFSFDAVPLIHHLGFLPQDRYEWQQRINRISCSSLSSCRQPRDQPQVILSLHLPENDLMNISQETARYVSATRVLVTLKSHSLSQNVWTVNFFSPSHLRLIISLLIFQVFLLVLVCRYNVWQHLNHLNNGRQKLPSSCQKNVWLQWFCLDQHFFVRSLACLTVFFLSLS